MIAFAYASAHGVSHLLTYVAHYFIARGLFDSLRKIGYGKLIGIGLLILLALMIWNHRPGRRRIYYPQRYR